MKHKKLLGLTLGLVLMSSQNSFCFIKLGDGFFTILQKLGGEVLKNPGIINPDDFNTTTGACAGVGLAAAGLMAWKAEDFAKKTQVDEWVGPATGLSGAQAVKAAAVMTTLYGLSFLSTEGGEIRRVLQGAVMLGMGAAATRGAVNGASKRWNAGR